MSRISSAVIPALGRAGIWFQYLNPFDKKKCVWMPCKTFSDHWWRYYIEDIGLQLFFDSSILLPNIFNPGTYTQTYTPHSGTRGGWWKPSLEFLISCSMSKLFCLQWKAFDLFNKMRYILWVVALLEASDVTSNSSRHLEFTKN